MKRLTIAAVMLAITLSSLSSFAQNTDDMKAMMAAAAPGEIHKMLAKSTGTWSGDISMWMQPGGAPMTSKGESTNEMVMGGRYLQTKSTGNFMGQPFQGMGFTGYDNVKKQFVNTWIDNMGTGIMTMTGTWDDATKSITFTGTMADPMSGKDAPVREVMKFIDDNHQVMEMWTSVAGKDFKTMEIKYIRQ